MLIERDGWDQAESFAVLLPVARVVGLKPPF
jgi:hypothetical protein